MAAALFTNTALTKLNLNRKQNSLQRSNRLQHHVFYCCKSTVNNIGKKGAKTLSAALEVNSTLQKLELQREHLPNKHGYRVRQQNMTMSTTNRD